MDLNLKKYTAKSVVIDMDQACLNDTRSRLSYEALGMGEQITTADYLEISEEGIIGNIIDWFKRKSEERAKKKYEKAKAEWQSYIGGTVDRFIDYVESLDPKRAAAKEVTVNKYDEMIIHFQATKQVLEAFISIDPMKYRSAIELEKAIKSKVATQKYFKVSEGTFRWSVIGDRKLMKFKGSKYDTVSSLKTLKTKLMEMDEAWYAADRKETEIINRFNTWMNSEKDDAVVRDCRKCVVMWINYLDLPFGVEAHLAKLNCANLNSMAR